MWYNDSACALVYTFAMVEETDMRLDEFVVDEIVRRILSVAKPDKIILFGSAASGRMTRDSDIDLLIIEAEPGDSRKKSVRLRQSLGDLGYPIDVLVISTEWFEESKDVIGGIAYPANKYGRVIYEAA
ncbi:MAG: nucleotidyltransferase domain-containing protein [Desulfomonilaceae bacterium]|nr:nucleotidyltransferase domain-containing protein [Desulfomonilaceae bacterium]